jgi:predicted HTH domain antitoxin
LVFQEALAKRNINIHYDMADVLKDIENLGIQL